MPGSNRATTPDSSCTSTNDHHCQTKKKHHDRNPVYSVHHAQVKRVGRIRIRLFENPDEIIKHITKLKVLFHNSLFKIKNPDSKLN
jgi:hypothetical protein